MLNKRFWELGTYIPDIRYELIIAMAYSLKHPVVADKIVKMLETLPTFRVEFEYNFHYLYLKAKHIIMENELYGEE